MKSEISYFIFQAIKSNRFKRLLFLSIVVFSFSCQKEEVPSVIYPKSYFPAYPGSYWVYTDGETRTVEPDYCLHSFQQGIVGPDFSEEAYVPKMGQQYVYQYGITQNSVTYPLKQLLSEKLNDSWVIKDWNNDKIKRKVVAINDTINIDQYPYTSDSVTFYTPVIVVIEFSSLEGEAHWRSKEYYAKNIGLIRRDINISRDTVESAVVFELVECSINHEFEEE